MTTLEQTLRTSIVTGLVSTSATGLTGMSWINFDHLYPMPCGFVGHETVQLCKRPTMEAAFDFHVLILLATSNPRRDANVFQVLEDKGTALWGVLYYPFGENMVMVSSLPKQFARKFFQVPCGRLGMFLLQLALQTEDAPLLLLPPLLTKKHMRRSHGRACQSEVNANDGLSRSNVRLRERDNYMQCETSLAITQVSTACPVSHVLHEVLRHGKGKFNAPVGGGKTRSIALPLDPIGALVIADRGYHALRTLHRFEAWYGASLLLCLCHFLGILFFFLGFPGKSRFHGFGGFDTRRTDQLRGKIGILHTKGIVRLFVQLGSIATLCRKSDMCNPIETRRVVVKRSLENGGLLMSWFQLYDKRSLHARRVYHIERDTVKSLLSREQKKGARVDTHPV